MLSYTEPIRIPLHVTFRLNFFGGALSIRHRHDTVHPLSLPQPPPPRLGHCVGQRGPGPPPLHPVPRRDHPCPLARPLPPARPGPYGPRSPKQKVVSIVPPPTTPQRLPSPLGLSIFESGAILFHLIPNRETCMFLRHQMCNVWNKFFRWVPILYFFPESAFSEFSDCADSALVSSRVERPPFIHLPLLHPPVPWKTLPFLLLCL